MTKDPVCGMTVDERKAGGTAVYQGKTYFFCGESCKSKFQKEPERYTGTEHSGHHH